MPRSEDSFQALVLFLPLCGSWIEFRQSGLAASSGLLSQLAGLISVVLSHVIHIII